ncbi:unnamed protein product, partial [Symbiodinium sp. KB8]
AVDPKTLEHCRGEFRTGKPKGGAVQQLGILLIVQRYSFVSQGEGGEQGDPHLMPAFHALAQHDTICDLQRQLRDGEAVFAFLDDVYIVALPESRALYDALSTALWDRARIRLHESKTRIWNAAGEEPPAVADLGGDAREPVGDWSLSPECQGLTVLGSPLGHNAFVAHHLQSKR